MSIFSDIVTVWTKYGPQILGGVWNTIFISIVGTLIGLLIGLINGVIRTIPTRKTFVGRGFMGVVNWLISAYVEVFRGTPMMVQAMIIYWGYAYLNAGRELPLIPAGIAIVSSDEDVVMITDTGIIKRLEASDIRVVDSTKSKGVTVMKFADDSAKIVSLAVTDRVSDDDMPAEEAVENTENTVETAVEE